MYDKKVAIVIKEGLLPWQKLNVVSFLAGSIAIQFPETHDEDFITADNVRFLPFMKHPILVYKAEDSEKMQRAFRCSRDRELAIGIMIYGENKKVDKALDGLKFHD